MAAPRNLLPLAFACAVATASLVRASSFQESQTEAAPFTPDFSIEREVIGQANAARAAGDFTTARAMMAEVVANLLTRPPSEQDTSWLLLLDVAARAAW